MRLHINMLIPSNTDCTVNYIIKKKIALKVPNTLIQTFYYSCI